MTRTISVAGETFNVDAAPSHGFWSAVNAGTWEPATFRVLDRFLDKNWRFVDFGAWIGPTTLYAGRKCDRIDAYECDPIALCRLRDNLAVNPDIAAKVTLYEHAVSDQDGFLRLFSRNLGNSETSIYNAHERGGEIITCTQTITTGVRDVRSVFRDRGYAGCERTLIKIDVEGAEFRILPALAEIASSSRCVWYVSFHEVNLNPEHLPARHVRAMEMLRSLLPMYELHWYTANLTPINKDVMLDALMAGTQRAGSSMVFCQRAL